MRKELLLLLAIVFVSCNNPLAQRSSIPEPVIFYTDSFNASITINANPFAAYDINSAEANIGTNGSYGIKASFTKNDIGINFLQISLNEDINKGKSPKKMKMKVFVPLASSEDLKIDSIYMLRETGNFIYIKSSTLTIYRSLSHQEMVFDISSLDSELASGKIVFGINIATPSMATASSPAFIYIDDIVFEY